MNPEVARPVMVDLFAGTLAAGVAFRERGWEYVPVEILRGQDVREWKWRGGPVEFAWASPPCTWYTDIPWWGRRVPDPSLWWRAVELFIEMRPRYWCIENVRGAQRWWGPADLKAGGHYFWSNCPANLPKVPGHKWRVPPGPGRKLIRSAIPYPISLAFAEAAGGRGA